MDTSGSDAMGALQRLSGLPNEEVARQLPQPADVQGLDVALDALRSGLRQTGGGDRAERVERVLEHVNRAADRLPRPSARRTAFLVSLLARSRARQHGPVAFDARALAHLDEDTP